MEPREQKKNRRRIDAKNRGATFGPNAAFESAVREQCRKEFLEASSPELLDRFLRRLDEVNARFDDEVQSHEAVARLLEDMDRAVDMAERLESKAASAPRVMVCTRVLATIADELRLLQVELNIQLNSAADDSIREADNAAQDEEIGVSFCLESWTDSLGRISWAKKPGHRECVFMALRHCEAVGARRAFRFLAAASLLSGGELITFRPHRTTVAEAIAYESKRMREVALELAPFWAACISEGWDVDEEFLEFFCSTRGRDLDNDSGDVLCVEAANRLIRARRLSALAARGAWTYARGHDEQQQHLRHESPAARVPAEQAPLRAAR